MAFLGRYGKQPALDMLSLPTEDVADLTIAVGNLLREEKDPLME